MTLASLLEPFETRVLSNGLFVLVKPMAGTPVAAADIWVGTGSVAEGTDEWGISHFLEHMFFKGTERRGVGQIDREVGALGGYINAATSYDFTHYYIVLPAEHILSALDILADALFHSVFDAGEVEKERRVVVEEIKRHEDYPMGRIYDSFMETAFCGTGYAHPILGRPECLERQSRQALLSYVRRRYTPSNCHLLVVGNVEPEAVFAAVEQLFDHPACELETEAECPFPMCPEQPVRVETRPDISQSYMLAGWVLPRLAGTRELYALDLFSTILGEGRSSRLHQRLTEELGLCPDARASYFDMRRLGLFYTDVSFEEGSYARVRQELADAVERARQEEPGERELEKAKKMLVSGFAFMNERASSIAGTFGQYRIHSELADALAYVDRIRSVTGEEVLAAAQRYLLPELYREVRLRPGA